MHPYLPSGATLCLWQGHLPEDEWKYNLRMSREVFMKLVEELRPFISPDPRSPNQTVVSAEKKLALTLYFLKDTGSIRMTANAFGIAKSTVSIIRHLKQQTSPV